MLDVFRRNAQGWLAKILMILLGLSFMVWGIADVFRNIGTSNAAAEVGSVKFSQEDFRRAYSERMQQLGRQIGRGITPDQARAIGLDRQVLSELLSEAALDQKVKSLGLNMSDEALARIIEKSPEFAGPGGFSHEYFLAVLRSSGTNETQYVAEQRRNRLRQELGQALVGNVAAPKVMADALRRYQSEERSVEFVTLKPDDAAGALPVPTPEQLKAYYEENKALFRAPEYRKLQVLVMTPETVAASIEMPEAELRSIYESQKDRYGTPEKREVQQIVFDKPEDAAAAAARIAAGTSFETIATERKLTDKDISLGIVSKREILDPAVAAAAFSLPVDQVSAPVSGRFGTVLLRVKKIEPSSQQPFEAVADTIRKEALTERARRAMLDLHDKVEDERGGGASVPEAATKLKLKFETIDAVDRSGRRPDGSKVEGLAGTADVLDAAFKAPVGTDNDTIELRGQRGYVWYDVVSTTPSHERAYDEVKEQVGTRWKNEQAAKKLAALADSIRAKLDSGQTFAQAAPGLAVSRRDKLTRGKIAEGFDAAMISKIFDTPAGKDGTLETSDGVNRIVYRVTSATVPIASFDAANADAALARGVQDDLLSEYIQTLQNELGVKVNEAMIRSATGADRN
jgi:peptidyl-prolyl cis-trans isomerase D